MQHEAHLKTQVWIQLKAGEEGSWVTPTSRRPRVQMLEPLEPSVMATIAHWEASSMAAEATVMS